MIGGGSLCDWRDGKQKHRRKAERVNWIVFLSENKCCKEFLNMETKNSLPGFYFSDSQQFEVVLKNAIFILI